jgi:glycosyltransferase involved in cell wall biosynthesis
MTSDPEIRLLVPSEDVEDPELSIVVPALNEQLTIVEFVEWCREGIARSKMRGEILIVDSSTDDTAKLAQGAGARVLCTPKRGLGRAYIDALPYIRGKYVVMGDCDLTYDFRELVPFADAFRKGAEYIMGSRFDGFIEDGAMPALHRYFGTPLTTWILNVMYSSRFTDIHCGMRGITKDGLARMRIQSQGWEYASEMVLKSVHMRLTTAEVPIRFYKDRDGRLSHHKRSGWFSPWLAGWVNLRAMFIYGADFFLYRPGYVLALLGSLVTFAQISGPITLGPVTLSLYWGLAGLLVATVGVQAIFMGIVAKVITDYTGDATKRFTESFPYDRTVLASFGIGALGLGAIAPLAVQYVRAGLKLGAGSAWPQHLAVVGLYLGIAAFLLFTFTLVLHSLVLNRGIKPAK